MSSIHQQLLQHLGRHTAYQIAQMLAAETDPGSAEFNRVKTRWQRWLGGVSLNSVNMLAKELELLGFELVIKRKS